MWHVSQWYADYPLKKKYNLGKALKMEEVTIMDVYVFVGYGMCTTLVRAEKEHTSCWTTRI